MNLKRAVSAQSLLNGAFALSLLLLLLISAISYKNTVDIKESTRSLVHSYDMRIELVQLLSDLKDAETGQRGFIITKDSVFLQPYRGAHGRVMRSFENLQALAVERPHQQEGLDSLKKLIDLRFSMLETTRLESVAEQKSRFPLLISMIRGKKAMDSNRLQIDRMLDLEFEKFADFQKTYRAANAQSSGLTVLFLVFSLAVFTVSFFNINRNIQTLKKANKRLTIATESMKQAEDELESKNRALEKSNQELDSFNHAASHDLQEPLRKMQLFISRIAETEAANLSDTGKEHFERIAAAATRMRALISDLLLFSATNRPDKAFERADLNKLLDAAKQELAQVIEEKKAVVVSVPLPEMRVIPFQIRQLLINLISNSIKYGRPDQPPVIEITCGPVVPADHPGLAFVADKNYVQISVADNGVGFDQQYADRVFELFYRLRNTAVEPGTGLGLAICKKIADNHGGFITAKGMPGTGAVFTVFLPE